MHSISSAPGPYTASLTRQKTSCFYKLTSLSKNTGHICAPFSTPLSLKLEKGSQVASAAAGTLDLPGDSSIAESSVEEDAEEVSRRAALFGRLRGLMLVIWTFIIVTPFVFSCMAIIYPIIMLFDKHRRQMLSYWNYIWATLSSFPFFSVDICGKENLPSDKQPAVYVANHTSYMDIAAVILLNRSFKFVSKETIFKLPLIGYIMAMTGHVKLVRMDKRSILKCLNHCQSLLENGTSVMFFPEGTRSNNKKLSEFKKGAFTLAVRAKCPVVPLSIVGTADIMPKGMEGSLFRGQPRLTVHPAIDTVGKTADEVLLETKQAIASSLPKDYIT